MAVAALTRTYSLIDAHGEAYQSPVKGAFGGNRGTKIYGLMNCKTAARYVAVGTYQKSRVFFADEVIAVAAGYRACAHCMPGRAAEITRSV